MIDIDKFKSINDTYGHPAGDAVLSQLGQVLRDTARGTDFSARYGGEEMAIICPETSLSEAALFAERVRQAIENHAFLLTNGDTLRVTVSVGAAAIPSNTTEPTGLIEAADEALYTAKEAGRNCIRIATPVRV